LTCFFFDGQKFSECLKKNVLVPVFLKNSECIQIENGFLEFKNIDIDNNGLLDIVFSGEIDYYCKTEEYGVDVSKRNPLKKDFVNVKFFYDENHKIWYCSNEKEVKRKFNL
jgi:hypothetical protein